MKTKIIASWTLAALLLLLAQSHASAHAFLDHAQPRVGATVRASPPEVKIWFTQNVEPAFSTIEVRDASGAQVDKKDTHRDPQNKSLLAVSLPPLEKGTYRVSWRVVSVDTHRTQGHFQFTVK